MNPHHPKMSVLPKDSQKYFSMRNLGYADQGFRSMAIADSGACRSVIPVMPIRDSGDHDRAIWR
jgi:hypothetical protein